VNDAISKAAGFSPVCAFGQLRAIALLPDVDSAGSFGFLCGYRWWRGKAGGGARIFWRRWL
jgi:hypothetical protein